MRMCKAGQGSLGAALRLAAVAVALPLAGAGGALAQTAAADSFGAQFYSFVPAAPTIETPKANDLSLWQNDYKTGQTAYRDGDFATALGHFQRAAEAGSPMANWYLGTMHRLGQGVPADAGKAFGYYRQAAIAYDSEQPNTRLMQMTVDSLVRVGDAYRAGLAAAGIERDVQRALNLYTMAAGHGHPAALYGIGLVYLEGDGVTQRPDQGVKWLMRAARKRYAPAETMLGDLFWDGKIVEQDRTRAIMWYRLAQQTARPDEQAAILSRVDAVMSAASAEERTTGEALATQWSQQYPADLADGQN
jgi:TPR repeat protein